MMLIVACDDSNFNNYHILYHSSIPRFIEFHFNTIGTDLMMIHKYKSIATHRIFISKISNMDFWILHRLLYYTHHYQSNLIRWWWIIRCIFPYPFQLQLKKITHYTLQVVFFYNRSFCNNWSIRYEVAKFKHSFRKSLSK